MAKIQIYVPDELHLELRKYGQSINASALFQNAVVEKLAALARDRAADEAIAEFASEFGLLTDAQTSELTANDQNRAKQLLDTHKKSRTPTGRKRVA